MAASGFHRLLIGLATAVLVAAVVVPVGGARAAHVAPGVVATVPAGFSFPEGLAVDPIANRVYVIGGPCCTTDEVGRVSVISGATDTVLTTIQVAGGALYAAVNSVTNRLYVTHGNGGPNMVTVIDTTSHSVLTTITVGAGPWGVAVNPVTNLVYVANIRGNSVSVIDGATDVVTSTIPLASPRSITVDPSTNRIYVALFSTVAVIDGTTDTVVAMPSIQSGFFGIDINPVTNRVYVPNFLDASVSVIDTLSNTTIATIPVGARPNGVGVNPITNRVYVANRDNNTVSIIDGATNTAVGVIGVGAVPFDVATNPATDRVYVTNVLSHTVSVIADLTPEQQITRLIDRVQALVPGALNQGQANALIAKLQAALEQLEIGNEDVAAEQLEAFVNQVEAFIDVGVLPPTVGQPLIDAANAIIDQLSA